VRGPYIARSESLTVRPQFQSETTAKDPTSAKSIYVADVPFTRTGKHAVIASAKLRRKAPGHQRIQRQRHASQRRPAAGA
jgi:hypothetical protein